MEAGIVCAITLVWFASLMLYGSYEIVPYEHALGRRRKHPGGFLMVSSQQQKAYPHPHIPAARLIVLCFSVFSSTWEDPKVGGGDKLFGSYVLGQLVLRFLGFPSFLHELRKTLTRRLRSCLVVFSGTAALLSFLWFSQCFTICCNLNSCLALGIELVVIYNMFWT